MTNKSNRGQAMMVLVMVLAVAILYVSEVFISTTSATSQTYEASEEIVLQEKAEGCLENAAIEFLRLPSYTGFGDASCGEGDISCTINISSLGGDISDLTASCQRSGRAVTVGMTATDVDGSYTFSKIKKR